MTAKRRLVPTIEVKEMLDFLRGEGFHFSAVDVRTDGVTFYPEAQAPRNDYDRWKSKD